MHLFDDEIIDEYMEWKHQNPDSFSWWSFVNMKADLSTALGFAKFYFPELIEVVSQNMGVFLTFDSSEVIISCAEFGQIEKHMKKEP